MKNTELLATYYLTKQASQVSGDHPMLRDAVLGGALGLGLGGLAGRAATPAVLRATMPGIEAPVIGEVLKHSPDKALLELMSVGGGAATGGALGTLGGAAFGLGSPKHHAAGHESLLAKAKHLAGK